MKKITAGIVLMMFFAFGASAQEKQDGHHREHKANHQSEYLTKDLNLSEAQKQQLKTIKENHRKQMTELNKNETITVKEMRDRRTSLIKEYRSKVEGVLTADQKAKIQDRTKESAEKRQQMEAKRMEKIKKDLALTDDQSLKLKTMNDSYKSKFEKLRKDEALDRTEKKEQFKALHEQHKEEMKSVLTQQQIEKLDAMKKDRGGRGQVK